MKILKYVCWSKMFVFRTDSFKPSKKELMLNSCNVSAYSVFISLLHNIVKGNGYVMIYNSENVAKNYIVKISRFEKLFQYDNFDYKFYIWKIWKLKTFVMLNDVKHYVIQYVDVKHNLENILP